jgi:hypothetical protein
MLIYSRIPVWPINALYLGPFTLYVYLKYGRPEKPGSKYSSHVGVDHEKNDQGVIDHSQMDHSKMDHSQMDHGHTGHGNTHNQNHASEYEVEKQASKAERDHNMHAMHHYSPDRPLWATVAVGVSHCGAGCVLGDIVGEWIIYGTNAMISGRNIWPELLVDYAFALLFGIIFQYFSIAPMSGDYGYRSVIRAIKADVLSLTCFEIGLFGWMLIYQIAIWDYKLMTNTYLYWWQMQVSGLEFLTTFS